MFTTTPTKVQGERYGPSKKSPLHRVKFMRADEARFAMRVFTFAITHPRLARLI